MQMILHVNPFVVHILYYIIRIEGNNFEEALWQAIKIKIKN